jgi:hypothetical protein
MGEKVWRLVLKELETIRITCIGCAVATEMSVTRLRLDGLKIVCPVCKKPFSEKTVIHGGGSYLQSLAEAISELAGNEKIQVEFIVRDKTEWLEQPD